MTMKSTNPKKAYGVLKPSAEFIPPIAIILESVVMALGASKYGAFNWQAQPVDATTYYSAGLRHLMAWYAGEDIDPESGVSHLAHVRACMGILMDCQESGILVDDRPKTSSVAAGLERLKQIGAAKSKCEIKADDATGEIADHGDFWEEAAPIDKEIFDTLNELGEAVFGRKKYMKEPARGPENTDPAQPCQCQECRLERDLKHHDLPDYTLIDWDTPDPRIMWDGKAKSIKDWVIKPGCQCIGCIAALKKIDEMNRYDKPLG